MFDPFIRALILIFLALFLTELVFRLSSDARSMNISSYLDSAGLFIAVALTTWTTLLITYRIYSTSKDSKSREKSRFRNILEIITESSILYSLVLVANALIAAIPPTQSNIWTVLSASAYLYALLSAITVRRSNYCIHFMALTCVVFRVLHLPCWLLVSPLCQIRILILNQQQV